MWSIELTVILAMIGVNALFAAYEIALASVSVGRLQLMVQENRRGAQAALFMKQNMEASLAAVQLGITLVGAIAAATGGAGAQEQIAPAFQAWLGVKSTSAQMLAVAVVVVPLTLVTILFGELVPKVFTLRNKGWVCLRLSPAMRWFSYAVWPAVWVFERAVRAITRWGERRLRPGLDRMGSLEAAEMQELRASAAWARLSRLIGHQQESIIVNAARLSSRTVREAMLSANHIRMLNLSDTLMQSMVTAHLDMHTRFPVTERAGDPQAIMGYVNFKDLVAHMRLAPEKPSLEAITRSIASYRDDMSIAACLDRLVRDHHHIALIRDSADRVLGMITMEDVIEELVGEIQDEYDRLPSHAVASGTAWVVGGGITLDKLREATQIDLTGDLPRPDTKILSDWIIGHLGREIEGGEEMERKGMRFLIRKVRRAKVLEVQITTLAQVKLMPKPS
jgi:putative hemolysin